VSVFSGLFARANRLAALVLVACGTASLPSPALIEHPRDSYIEVPYPPPAALAEIVTPPPPVGDLVWLDGDWTFRGKSYAWRRGGWFSAPTGARYAPSKVLYVAGGSLMFAPGTWYDSQGQALPRQRPVRAAATPPNDVTSEALVGR
jgi:hypothetical protein